MVMNFVWMFKSFPFQDSTPSLFDDFCCFTFGISISKKKSKIQAAHEGRACDFQANHLIRQKGGWMSSRELCNFQ